VKNILKNNVVT